MGNQRKANRYQPVTILIMMAVIIILSGCSSAQKENTIRKSSDTLDYAMKRADGIDFTAKGDKWTLDMDLEGKLLLKVDEKEFPFETTKAIVDANASTINFKYKGNRNLNILIKKEPCEFSGTKRNYSVSVSYEMYDLNGCGDFINPEKNPLLSPLSGNTDVMALNDIFVLEQINGNTLEKYEFMRGKPMIEFRLSDSRVGGNSGTNEFFGKFEADAYNLKIGNLGATKIAPPDEFESLYFDALRKVRAWSRDGMKLMLLDESANVLLQFKKVD